MDETDRLFFVRHRWADPPIVLLDGAGTPLARATAPRRGAAAVCPRPTPIADLAGMLHTLVANRLTPAVRRLWSMPAQGTPGPGGGRFVRRHPPWIFVLPSVAELAVGAPRGAC